MRGVNEKADNTREIFLVSSDVYDKLINNLQKLDIVKFLVSLAILLHLDFKYSSKRLMMSRILIDAFVYPQSERNGNTK